MKHWHKKFLELCYEGMENDNIISLSAGFGVFMGIIPLWGFQMLIGVALAHLFRLNKPIVVLFSNISIPIMIPIILFASVQTGALLLHQQFLSISISSIHWQFCQEILLQYILGSIVFAIIAGSICYCCCRIFLLSIRKQHRNAE